MGIALNNSNSNFNTNTLGNIISNHAGTNSSHNNNNINNNYEMIMDYEEILVTIRKSERGFGFELKNGILIVKVLPSKIYYFQQKKNIDLDYY